MPNGPLRRSPSNQMIAGVCAGLAQWLGWDPTAVRILYVAATLFTAGFPGTLLYIIMWAVMPV
jgi:phage shock protein C